MKFTFITVSAPSLKCLIKAAKEILRIEPGILDLRLYSDGILYLAAQISVSLGVDGHRADISMIKTASTNAAYDGRYSVSKEDMKLAAELVLPHRMRRKPFEEQQMDIGSVFEMIESREGV